MDNYAEILGHEPTERTRQTLDRLNTMVQNFWDENPELTLHDVWEIFYEAAEAVIAKRESAEG